jgi:hypothetical protein
MFWVKWVHLVWTSTYIWGYVYINYWS